MGENTKISWTDHSWNPWIGCARVSPGCLHCYAETQAERWGLATWGKTTERRVTSDAYWRKPLTWNRKAEAAGVPAKVFCASMADVFEDHPDLPEPRERLWDLVDQTPWLRWLLLTKRPENINGMLPDRWKSEGWPDTVWLGTSVEDQQRADERVPVLLDTNAAVKWLSAEPLLGSVDLMPWLGEVLTGVSRIVTDYGTEREPVTEDGIAWVIAGGESGGGARRMDIEWARSLREQCAEAGTAFFFKQLGAVAASERGVKGKGEGFDGVPADLAVREFPLDPCLV